MQGFVFVFGSRVKIREQVSRKPLRFILEGLEL
jgi:hypothetical protein